MSKRTIVRAGDTIIVGHKAKALLTYDDGCRTTIDPGTVVRVRDISPCQYSGVATKSFKTELIVGVAVAGGLIALIATRDKDSSP